MQQDIIRSLLSETADSLPLELVMRGLMAERGRLP